MSKIKYNQKNDEENSSWQLQEAKACFSEVVRRAQHRPQRVTLRGKSAVVILSAQDYERLQPTSKCSLVELMASSPLAEVEFGERGTTMPIREIQL